MTGQTRGIDLFDNCFAVSFLTIIRLISTKYFLFVLMAAPSLVGIHSGFVSLLKKHIQNENLHSFHCIIHQESLAIKFGEELKKARSKVVQVVNYIRSHELNHRMLQEFLKELNSQYGDVLYHTEVRWLSKGKVLERFFY